MHRAIAEDDKAMVIGLLSAGINPDVVVESTTPVQRAIRLENHGILRLLFEYGATITADDFLYAVELGNNNAVELYLDHGADANSADPYEMTALIHAALNGHRKIVRRLLEAGAEVNHREVVEGYTALMLAAAHGYGDIAELLLEAGADTDLVTHSGHTALSWALERSKPGSGHKRIIKMLRAR